MREIAVDFGLPWRATKNYEGFKSIVPGSVVPVRQHRKVTVLLRPFLLVKIMIENLAVLTKELDYDSASGALSWKRHVSGRRGTSPGAINGCGYLNIMVSGKQYLGHRLAWLLHYKEEPPKSIDHIDGDRSNNRILNLRASTQLENTRNTGISNRNKSGFKGVSWDKASSKWRACISVNRKYLNLGLFDDIQEAAKSYRDAAIMYFGEFANPATKEDARIKY